MSSNQKELNGFTKNLFKTRDKYYKLCKEELPKPDADYAKVETEKNLYEGSVRGTNRYFSLFYTQTLPKILKRMEEFLLRRVISIQDVLKKLLLIRKISTEKMISINNDVLSYLDEIDPESELEELLKKYNPEQTPFIYSDKYEYQEYKGLDTLKMAKTPQLLYLIPQVDPSTLCQNSSRGNGFRARTYSDPESDNNGSIPSLATSSLSTQSGATSIPSMASASNTGLSSSCPPGSSPTSPLAQPITNPAGTSPSSNLNGSAFGGRKGRKKSIMSFRLHRKSTDSSASDGDGMPGAARSQVFADAAAAAQERSSKSRQHKNSDGTTMGGYRGSMGRQGHISVDYTDKLGTLFSSSSSALPSISKTTYSSSNVSSALSMSPDPFSPPTASSPGSSPSRVLQQQQSYHQLNQLPSFNVVTRSSSVAAVPVSPPVAIPHELSGSSSGVITGVAEKKSTVLFGTPLKDLPATSSSSSGNKQIPDVLKFFLKGMLKANVQETPNVFKRGGKAPLIAAFKKELNAGTFNYNSDPYVAADVFKFWIRSLPDPLIPNTL